jgi:hypothetical protein
LGASKPPSLPGIRQWLFAAALSETALAGAPEVPVPAIPSAPLQLRASRGLSPHSSKIYNHSLHQKKNSVKRNSPKFQKTHFFLKKTGK